MPRLLPFVLIASLVVIVASDIFKEMVDLGASQDSFSESLSESRSNPLQERMKKMNKNNKIRQLRDKQQKRRDRSKTRAKKGKINGNTGKNRNKHRDRAAKSKKKKENLKNSKTKNKKKDIRKRKKKIMKRYKKRNRKQKQNQKKNRKTNKSGMQNQNRKSVKRKNVKKKYKTKHLQSRVELTCLDNIKKTMLYESRELSYILVQILRTHQWLKQIESKKKKKDIFKKTAAIFAQALANANSSSSKANSRFTQRTFENARSSRVNLGRCSSLIEESCISSIDRFEDTLTKTLRCLPNCSSTMNVIREKASECDKATPEKKCDCWAEATGLVENAKSGTCQKDALNAMKSVKKKRTICVHAFISCKQAEDSSIAILKNLLDKVEIMEMPISEEDNGETSTYIQEIKYNPNLGVLTIAVPAHKEYTNTTFTLIRKQDEPGIQVIKSGGVCLVSESKVDIIKMKTAMSNNNNSQMKQLQDKIYKYSLKMKQSIIGGSKRYNSDVNIRDSCIDTVIFQTQDVSVSKTDYNGVDKLEENGELKETWNPSADFFRIEPNNGTENDRLPKCFLSGGKTGKIPEGCMHGFIFDETATDAKDISIHSLSRTTINIRCCSKDEDAPPNCCRDLLIRHGINEKCICATIIHKSILSDCYLANEEHTRSFEDSNGWLQQQSMKLYTISGYNPSMTRALEINLPNYKIIFHTAKNGYWHSTPDLSIENNMIIVSGNTCSVYTLSNDIYPVEMAYSFQNLDKIVSYSEITNIPKEYVCEPSTKDILHTDMSKFCQDKVTQCKDRRNNVDSRKLKQVHMRSVWMPKIIEGTDKFVQKNIFYEYEEETKPVTLVTPTPPTIPATCSQAELTVSTANAINNNAVGGVLVILLKDDTEVDQVITNTEGQGLLTSTHGQVVLTAQLDGFTMAPVTITVVEGECKMTIKLSLSPTLAPAVTGGPPVSAKPEPARVVMNWGPLPKDLDLHVKQVKDDKIVCHCFHDNKNCDDFILDVDNRHGGDKGAETVTWSHADQNSKYVVYVHKFTPEELDSTHLSSSGARVAFYLEGEEPTHAVNVPTNGGHTKRYWKVGCYNSNGFTLVNQLATTEPENC